MKSLASSAAKLDGLTMPILKALLLYIFSHGAAAIAACTTIGLDFSLASTLM
jgi:hypothetical protein